jgi:AcrR family transcriptional regulator
VAPLRTRRTQEQRRALTRGKLLDATIQSLIDVGYAGTTTRAVGQRAGVSSGAQTHHFPRRVDLVGAAVERLTQQRTGALRHLADELPRAPEARVRSLLDVMWADFSGPVFTVFVKLWIAADDDEELYERLVPLERMLARSIVELLAELRGDLDAPVDLDARVLTALAALRGMALTQTFEPRARRGSDPWLTVRPVLERMILAP